MSSQDSRVLRSRPRRAWFTSATTSYWSRVRTLATSVSRWHPDDDFILVAVDHPDDPWDRRLSTASVSDIVTVEELRLTAGFDPLPGLSIVEMCTAVKGAALVALLARGYDQVGYLDPDTVVFHSLEGLIDTLEDGDIALVPHQLTPDTEDWAIRENEVSSLRHGVFNFGCLMVRASDEAVRFAAWWRDRLNRFCVDAPCDGLFTDQKWGDLVPIFFPTSRICRDPGVNVASWNLRERTLSLDVDGSFRVALRPVSEPSAPLQLFHFTKAGSVGEFVTARHGGTNPTVAALWRWYLHALEEDEAET